MHLEAQSGLGAVVVEDHGASVGCEMWPEGPGVELDVGGFRSGVGGEFLDDRPAGCGDQVDVAVLRGARHHQQPARCRQRWLQPRAIGRGQLHVGEPAAVKAVEVPRLAYVDGAGKAERRRLKTGDAGGGVGDQAGLATVQEPVDPKAERDPQHQQDGDEPETSHAFGKYLCTSGRMRPQSGTSTLWAPMVCPWVYGGSSTTC